MAVIRQDCGRAIIEGVRKIGWGMGEMCEFASALVSALGTLGEAVPYHYLMGTSGAAFRLTLNTSIWEPGSFSITCVAADPHAPIYRAFAAIGRDFVLQDRGDEESDTATITASIDQGIPVLAFGVVGPADCSLITGYDEGGKVLLGWSPYQDIPDDHNIPPDKTGYFRKPEWHGNTRGYILIGARRERPPVRTATLDALRWAVALMRQPAVREMPAGLGAYERFADVLLRDGDFPANDLRALGGPYLGILCILMMVDDRRSAVDFLSQATRELPDLGPDLLAAAACYRETIRLRDALKTLMPEDFSEAAMRRLADPGLRRDYAATVRQMGHHDAEAIAHIARALARA